jgi:LysM repeat protein
MQRLTLALTVALIASLPIISLPIHAQSLKGSRASMERQNQIAIKQGYTFIKTSKVVAGLVTAGDLVEVRSNSNFEFNDVSYPFARPPVKAFVERLASQYRVACGEKMVVTSLTRPIDRQPANASSDSVHPTGMAVDLRIPSKQKCRTWLENYLLAMEGDDVLDVTRERRPPHYHVAVFPDTYEQYVANLSTSTQEYTVRSGDTLSRIASITGTSVAQLRSANGLHNDTLQVGQKLLVRAAAEANGTNAPNAAVASAPPAPAAPPSVAATMADQVTAVTVRRGDTLSRIATKTGTSVEQLRAINGLRGDMLQVGQKLLLQPTTITTATDTSVAATTAASAVPAAPSPAVAAMADQQVTAVTVRRGDSLSRIATKTGTSVEQLRAINGLRSDMLQVGQKLLLRPTATATATTAAADTSIASVAPVPGVLAVTAASTASASNNQIAAATVSTHRVKRGETLWRIARRYGTTADALVAKNGLASDILQVGQTLTVK